MKYGSIHISLNLKRFFTLILKMKVDFSILPFPHNETVHFRNEHVTTASDNA